jgi:streptogramin lyase
MIRSRILIVVGLCVVLAVAAMLAAAFLVLNPHRMYPCAPQSMVQRSQISSTQFDAMTEFNLPQNRSPNAITVSTDGSVWFAELGVPALGHLYPANGTLVEYRLPFGYPPASSISQEGGCFDWTDTWGITIWNGTVWASDQDNGSLVGLHPASDTFESIKLSSTSMPYTLVAGPDGHLWFTDLSQPARIGDVNPGTHSVSYYYLPSGARSASAYLLFQNATLGYVLSIFPYTGGAQLFSFDPSATNPSFVTVGGNLARLGSQSTVGNSSVPSAQGPSTPTSIAVGEGGLWLAVHSSSDMAFFNATAGRWVLYPTSTVPYIAYTLPYFDVSNGSAIWFNEHYGNRLGEICCHGGALTEYSFSNPPAREGTQIDNALTITQAQDRVWFTEWTANIVGFASSSYAPSFSIKPESANDTTIAVRPGATTHIQVEVSGSSSTPLSLRFSDSEQPSGTPRNINFSVGQAQISALSGTQQFAISVRVSTETPPGPYMALVTVTDGLVSRSIYVAIDVV